MVEAIHRDVFKLDGQNNAIRFGAKFIEADGLKENGREKFRKYRRLNKIN